MIKELFISVRDGANVFLKYTCLECFLVLHSSVVWTDEGSVYLLLVMRYDTSFFEQVDSGLSAGLLCILYIYIIYIYIQYIQDSYYLTISFNHGVIILQ